MIEVQGTITAEHGYLYTVTLDNGHKVTCHLCGKIIKNKVKVTIGDIVTVRLSPYDLDRGIIRYRH